MNPSQFELNRRTVALDPESDPRESLLRWLKRHGHTGTKEGCADGDCGACTVAWLAPDADGVSRYRAINSCLLPLGETVGRSIVTVEGLAAGDRLHPVQQAMVDTAGSQCGYCTPGFVMSLFVAYEQDALNDHAIDGNLCRCTGYVPIRRAMAQLRTETRVGGNAVACEPPPSVDLPAFHNPRTVTEALRLKQAEPRASFIAGATDLGVPMSRGQAIAPAFIALDRIDELQRIERSAERICVGAGVSLSRLEQELHGVLPALDQMLPWFAARQVKNRATIGGNLGSASPIGDLLPILLALDATIEMQGPAGSRSIAAQDFFLGYRQTARQSDEIIVAVTVPLDATLIQASYKVAKRQTDDISIVAASFALKRDHQGRVAHVRLAYGGVAAVPQRALASEAKLLGRHLDAETIEHLMASLRQEFAPLSDHRAGKDYRLALIGNLFKQFVAEHCA